MPLENTSRDFRAFYTANFDNFELLKESKQIIFLWAKLEFVSKIDTAAKLGRYCDGWYINTVLCEGSISALQSNLLSVQYICTIAPAILYSYRRR